MTVGELPKESRMLFYLPNKIGASQRLRLQIVARMQVV